MKRTVRFLMTITLFLLLTGVSAQAASQLGTVKNLRAVSVSENSITLKWNKVSGADGYAVYRVAGSRRVHMKTTDRTTYTVSKLKLGSAYGFQVCAVKKVKNTKIRGKFSNVCAVKTEVKTPGVPKNFAVGVNGGKTLELTWDAAPYATGYEIYQYNKSKKSYTKKKTVKETSCLISGLKVDKEYTFVVRSVRKVGKSAKYSNFTAKKTGTPIRVSKEVRAVRTCYYYAILKSTVRVKNITTGKQQTLQAGTKVISTSKTGAANSIKTVRLLNGQRVQVRFGELDVPQGIEYDADTDYSKQVKEDYVNSKNMRSETDYLVWINHYHARVNIFKGSVGKWKLVRTFKVAIGKNGSVKGYRTICKKERNGHYDGTTPIIYWSPMGNAFHTLLGAEPGDSVSSGCIRCETEDLMYLYDEIPLNTLVYSY